MIDILIRIMADGLVFVVVLIGVWTLLFRLKTPNARIEVYARILMAGLTAYLTAKLVGSIYQPEFERPFQQLGQVAGAAYLDNPGFPSDHVLFCVAITWAVLCESRSRKIALFLAILTLMVGLGRVLALVHTPLDVIGGIVIGSLGAIWYLQTPKTAYDSTIGAITRKKSKKRLK